MHIKLNDLLRKMQEQLDTPKAVLDESLLIELVNRIRPSDTQDLEETHEKFQAFLQALLLTPDASSTLQHFVLRLINQYKQTSLFADTGILSLDGFWNQLFQRLGAHFLPLIHDESQLQDLVRRVFPLRSDKYWLDNIEDAEWQQLFTLLNRGHGGQTQKRLIRSEIIKALTVLSYRVSGIGLYPEFINAYPELSEYDSPFLAQNREINEFIQLYKVADQQHDQISAIQPPDASQALVMIDQCHDVSSKIRRATKRTGVSISLTYLLSLLEQCLERIELLLNLIVAQDKVAYVSAGQLLVDVTSALYSERSVRSLLAENSELIALQVTENASKTGEHYVSTDKDGFWSMYKAAAGAGVLIAMMATLKTLASRLVLAPMMQAIINSMIYSFGFMLIHVLHFTVATKQPAMTAAALASTVQHRKGSKMAQIAELAA